LAADFIHVIISLGILLFAAKLMAEEEDEVEEVQVRKKDLWMIGRNAARLDRLSSDILDVSRIEGGALT
jgi:hypothetical protein